MTGPRNAAVAAELRAEAARQQLTARELARRAGRPDTTVARWLRAGTAMDLDEIEMLATALDVAPFEMIARAWGASPQPTPGLAASSGWNRRLIPMRLIRPAARQLENVA